MKAVVAAKWSSQNDLLAGIEDLGLRAVAMSGQDAGVIEAELFSFGTTVSSDAGLELALASKLGKAESKAALVENLLAGKVAPQTLVVMRHLVQQPRGRRIGELLRYAASVISDQSGYSVATVTSARPLAPAQLNRLKANLSGRYGRALTLNLVIDPAVVGGVRVQIGDDVIDGSVASRLSDLRLQLAG
jgi:F-type H+-transporting ATPase subunit delta